MGQSVGNLSNNHKKIKRKVVDMSEYSNNGSDDMSRSYFQKDITETLQTDTLNFDFTNSEESVSSFYSVQEHPSIKHNVGEIATKIIPQSAWSGYPLFQLSNNDQVVNSRILRTPRVRPLVRSAAVTNPEVTSGTATNDEIDQLISMMENHKVSEDTTHSFCFGFNPSQNETPQSPRPPSSPFKFSFSANLNIADRATLNNTGQTYLNTTDETNPINQESLNIANQTSLNGLVQNNIKSHENLNIADQQNLANQENVNITDQVSLNITDQPYTNSLTTSERNQIVDTYEVCSNNYDDKVPTPTNDFSFGFDFNSPSSRIAHRKILPLKKSRQKSMEHKFNKLNSSNENKLDASIFANEKDIPSPSVYRNPFAAVKTGNSPKAPGSVEEKKDLIDAKLREIKKPLGDSKFTQEEFNALADSAKNARLADMVENAQYNLEAAVETTKRLRLVGSELTQEELNAITESAKNVRQTKKTKQSAARAAARKKSTKKKTEEISAPGGFLSSDITLFDNPLSDDYICLFCQYDILKYGLKDTKRKNGVYRPKSNQMKRLGEVVEREV